MGFIALQRAKLHYVFENIFHVVERLVSKKEAKMNKIFKVIWSKSKQCYVVVSEMAKNTTGKKKIIVASIFAAMVAGQAMQVEAAYGKIANSTGTGSLAISGAGGTGATASTDDAIAVGQDASATGRGGIAVGRKSNAVHNALSIGWIASAKTKGAIAIGSALEEDGVPGQKEVVSDGFYSIAIGGASQSSGTTSIALGVKSSATNESATAIGKSSNASGIGAFAAGLQTKATGDGSVAIGGATSDTASNGATASGAASIAMGYKSKASSQNAVSIGSDTEAANLNATAVGSGAKAKANGAGAFGLNANANGENTFAAVGGTASGNSAIAIGDASNASQESATALGRNTTATGVNSSAIGAYSIASDTDATALGRNANATAAQSTALGTYSKALGTYSTGVGYQANASGSNSTAVGVSAKANKDGASAMGAGARAYGNGAISFGYQALSGANIFNSAGNGSFNDASPDVTSYAKWGDSAIGLRAIASGGNATALGRSATATAANAIAIGGGNGDSATDNTEKTEATGEKSTAIGYNAKAKTGNDLAVGRGVTSSGGAATAVGYYATASGNQTVALGSTINSTAQYATGIGYSVNSQGEGSVAIGAGTDALGSMSAKKVQATAKNAIAIGRATQATSQDATAIGTEATASNTDAVAIGRKSNASGSTSIGLGYNTKASDTNTVAIGTDVSATAESAIALGRKTTASGLSSTAVGPLANASGKYSSAFGMSATTSEENALALGTSANATRKNSVSLGSNSSTVNAATSENSVTFGNKNITWTAGVLSGTNLDGMQVSVGATGAERQIKNVAAGKISATSTDAINGAQLYAVAEGLRTKYVSINSTISNNQNNDGATGSDSVAIGPDAAATKADSVAMGRSVKANGQQSIAVGKSAEAKQDYNVAIGSEVVANGNNSVAMGRYASSTGTAALAIGTYGNNKSTASGNYSIAIGRDVTASGVDSIATGRDSKATAEKALAYGANAQALATNSIAIGADSQANVDKGIAIGAGSKANVASGVAGYNANTENIARTDKYAGLTGVALNSNLGALSVGVTDASGAATSTRQIVGVAAGQADTDAVNVAQLKSVNLAFKGNSGSGDVNLSKSKLAVEGGTDSFITTTAANKKLEIKTTQGTLQNTSGTVSVNGANGLAVAQNVADVINQANADRTITYKANGTGNNSVKLSDGLNFKNGTTTTATVGTNGQVSFDLNTATKQSITDSATAVARTISLGGDTGTTTAKSLSSGDVNFGIKSGSPTYLTTKATGNDVTLTIDEQAIKNAAKSASAWNLTTNSSTTDTTSVGGGDTVDLVNGDNIEITQDGTDKKKITVATKKDITVDSVTANNKVTVGSGANKITLDGATGAVSGNTFTGTSFTAGNTIITTTGLTSGTGTNAVSFGTNGISAGNQVIANVASGGTTATNAANIGDVQSAVANLSQNLKINDGTHTGTVNLKTQDLNIAGANGVTTNVNGQTITVGLSDDAKNATSKGIALTGDSGTTGNKYLKNGDVSFAVTGDSNLVSTTATATGVQVSVDSAKIKDLAAGAVTVSKDAQVDNPITVTPTSGTNSKDYAIGIDTTKLASKTELTYRANDAADANAKKVSLAKGLNFVNGTSTVATVGDDGKVSFDLNATTKDAIDKSQAAMNRTVSLGADSGTASSQSLKDDNVAFNVKGAANSFITTEMDTTDTNTVNIKTQTGVLASNTATGKASVTGADGLATAQNVADAINAAADKAKAASAWKLTTNSSTADTTSVGGGDTVDLVNGDNIEITQDGTDKKKITVATKKDITVDSVTANNRVTVGSGANAINLNGATGAITGKTATIGGVTVNGTANTIGGLSNTTWNGTATTGRAATEDQLKAVADSASSQKWKITADKTGTLSNQTGTKKEATVGKDETVELVAGDNLTIDQNERKFTYSLNKELKGLTSVGIGNGTTQTITLNGANKTAIIGGVTVDGTNNFVTGLANTTWNGTATTGRAATEDQLKSVADAAKSNTDAVALKFTGDVAANTGTVNLKDDTFGIKGDGKYISTDVNGNNVKLTVSEAAVKKSAVAAVTVSTDTNDTNNPLTVRSIPGTDGTTMEYKVTIDGTKIANKTHLSYKANNGTAKQVSLADGLDFTNGTMTTATIDDKGVVKYSVNTVTITAGTDGTITAPTADGVATAKNVADAINAAKKASTTVLTANGGEGANATTGNVTLTSTTEADGHTKYDVKLNNKVTLGTGANAVTIDGTAGKATIGTSVIDGVNNTFTTGGTHSVNVDGSTGTVTGLTNTTWNGTATTGRAATEDQLKAVADQASKNAAASTTEVTVNGGNQANVTSGNLLLAKTKDSTDGHTKFDIKLNDKVEFGTGNDKITVDGTSGIITTKNINASGDVNAKNVTTTADVTAGGTVTGSTLKAGNVTVSGTTNTITGLSNTTWNGTTTTPNRAATESQLQQAISSVASSATFKFDGDNNSQQTMNLQNGTFNVTGDTMITTNATSTGVRLLLNTNNVKIAYAANGTNGQTTSLASGFNFKDGAHTKATVDSNGVVKYNAQTSTISVANGHATASGNDLATADNVADAINQMTQNNSGNTTQLRQEISKVATETQRVGAHAAAMAALKPIQYDPLAPTQIMAGVGNYRGESAAALGIAHYTNDNTMFNVGVSVGGNHNMINAGVTHKFGISAEKKNIPDRYKAGPISSIYVMQDEMTQLRSENEAYKAKLDKQQSEIDALKAAVDQLLASKA